MSEAVSEKTIPDERDTTSKDKTARLFHQIEDLPPLHLDIEYLSLKGPGVAASLVLHCCIIVLAVFGVDWMLPVQEPEPLVINVTLDNPEEPPPAEEEAVEQPAPPEEVTAEAALPPEAVVVEEQGDGAKLISANKSDEAVIHPQGMFFGGQLKQGNEVRWSLRALGAEEYTLEDYVGNYRIRGEDRIVRIIDGRKKYGKLLFLDEKTDTLRALTQFGNKIFTYGPTFEAEEPVIGSITFLPVKHHAESGDLEIPSRILWLPEEPPMKFGEMIRFDERQVVVAQGLRGLLTTPPGDASVPAVVWVADAGCRSFFAYRIIARELALHGVAMLSLDPPACPDPGEGLRPLVTAAEVRQGVDFLRARQGIDPARVGVWARNGGLEPAQALFSGQNHPAFLITMQEEVDRDALPAASLQKPQNTPSLWFFVGNTAWSETMRNAVAGRDAEVHTMEEPRGYDTRSDPDADVDRLKLAGPVYTRETLQWLGIRGEGDGGDSD